MPLAERDGEMTEQQSIQSAGLLLPLAGGEAKAATSFCLIVDDEKGIRNLIARSLRNHLVMTEGCGDASSALDALKLRTPDLIFLDISLERSDAIEVIRGLGEMKFDGAVQLMSGRDLRSLEEIKRVGEKHKLRMLPVLRKPFRGDLIPGILRNAGIASKEPPVGRRGHRSVRGAVRGLGRSLLSAQNRAAQRENCRRGGPRAHRSPDARGAAAG